MDKIRKAARNECKERIPQMKAYVNEVPSWAFPAEFESEHRFNISDYVAPNTRFGRFMRKNAILLVGLAILILWTWAIGTICYHNGKVDAREELTAEYEAKIELAVQSVHEEYQAKTFVSGDASRKAAISAEAKHLAKIGQALLNSYKGADVEDARKVMLCAVCRVLSDGEFSAIQSIEQACKAKDQWWGYADAYTKEVYEVAEEVATMYENNEPLPCDTHMVYASWNGTEIVLRNQWEANASARYW